MILYGIDNIRDLFGHKVMPPPPLATLGCPSRRIPTERLRCRGR